MHERSWRLMTATGLILGALAIIVLWRPAASQTIRLFDDRNILIECFQNGEKIFAAGPLESLNQVGVERTVEFVGSDGDPGQIRVVGTAVCFVSVE